MAKAFEPKMCTAISAKLEALSNLKIDKKKKCVWQFESTFQEYMLK